MKQNYHDYLISKHVAVQPDGFEVVPRAINPKLFPFQRDIVRWACRLGRSAIFANTGLGKTLIQLEVARLVAQYTGGKILGLVPLAVSGQTIREGGKFSIPARFCEDQDEADTADERIIITNYEKFLRDRFDPGAFSGVFLDESSVLKNYTGATKRKLLIEFANTPFRHAYTATPAPNDHIEIGNHAEFLGVMPSNEMLTRWFNNDSKHAQRLHLKPHGKANFWRWVTGWAVCILKPGDLGPAYDMPEFELPELIVYEHVTQVPQKTIDRAWTDGKLFPDAKPSATDMHRVKRESVGDRARAARAIIEQHGPNDVWIVWCDTNYEADKLMALLPDAIEVRGSENAGAKEEKLLAFSEGRARIIVTKPSIAGFGLNWQHCHNVIFIGVSYSFEATYQALRRTWRYGQDRPVRVWMIYSKAEGNIMARLREKELAFAKMQQEMNAAMAEHGLFRDEGAVRLTDYAPAVDMQIPAWLREVA